MRLYTTERDSNEHSEWHKRHTTCHILNMKYHKILLHHIFPTKMYFLGILTTTAPVNHLLAVSTGKCSHDSPLQTQAHYYRDQSQNATTIRSWTHILKIFFIAVLGCAALNVFFLHYYISIKFY